MTLHDGGVRLADQERIAELAAGVAIAAGEELLRRWGTATPVGAKTSETDFVTDADLASESLIRSLLLAERPHDGMLGEELASIGGSSGLRWIVDPLDGTLNFLHGLPQWAVSIAAESRGTPLVGVVHAPALDVTYSAASGCGAWANGGRIRGSQTEVLAQAVIGTGFCYPREARARQVAAIARLLPWVADVRISGSAAIDLCSAAAGKLDAYCETGLAPYDYAAGALVASEAGLSVAVPKGEENDWVVAAPAQLVTALREVLGPAGGE